MVTVALLWFVGTWNNYFLPLIVLRSQEYQPITVGLATWYQLAQQGGGGGEVLVLDHHHRRACRIIPVIVVFLLLQRFWQGGLTAGPLRRIDYRLEFSDYDDASKSSPLSVWRPISTDTFLIGAPHYPEHVDESYWQRDADRMAAAGFNTVRLAEFAWHIFEPHEGTFDFDLFDRAIASAGQGRHQDHHVHADGDAAALADGALSRSVARRRQWPRHEPWLAPARQSCERSVPRVIQSASLKRWPALSRQFAHHRLADGQ